MNYLLRRRSTPALELFVEWKVSDREVVMQENLEIRETVAPPSEYAAIRAFFDQLAGARPRR
jgi:hypothetical protein